MKKYFIALASVLIFSTSAFAASWKTTDPEDNSVNGGEIVLLENEGGTDNNWMSLNTIKSWVLSGLISDVAYDTTTWDNVTDVAASKNSIRDYLESRFPTGTDGTRRLIITNNPGGISPTAGELAIYPDAGIWKMNTNGIETTILNNDSPLPVKIVGTFAVPTTSPAVRYELAASDSYNSSVFYNDTDILGLPAAVAGMNTCIYVTGSNLTTIDPNGTDVMVVDGTANAAGDAVTIAGVAGNFLCLVADAANHWVTMGSKGTITAL